MLDEENRILKNTRSNVTETTVARSEEELQLKRLLADFGKAKNDNLPSIQLEYKDGTPCDVVDGEAGQSFDKRSSTVEITCGKFDSVLEIREDRTVSATVALSFF